MAPLKQNMEQSDVYLFPISENHSKGHQLQMAAADSLPARGPHVLSARQVTAQNPLGAVGLLTCNAALQNQKNDCPVSTDHSIDLSKRRKRTDCILYLTYKLHKFH